MPTLPLAHRITDFLNRQIAWSEAVLNELEAADNAEEAALESLLERQQVREREAKSMAREYNGLLFEWNHQTDAVPEDEHVAIQMRSKRAQDLIEAVRLRYIQAQRRAEQQAQQRRKSLNDLRRGRRSATIYRPEMLVSPGFIDRKA